MTISTEQAWNETEQVLKDVQRLVYEMHWDRTAPNTKALVGRLLILVRAYQQSASDTADNANKQLRTYSAQCDRIIKSLGARLKALDHERATGKQRIAEMEQELVVVRRAMTQKKKPTKKTVTKRVERDALDRITRIVEDHVDVPE